MNELEKVYQEIERWHCCAEQEGFANENDILYLDYVKKHINNLQSKIDKAIEYIEENGYNVSNNILLDILKEDK